MAGGEIGKNRSELWNAGSGRNARSGQPRPEAWRREIEKGAQLDRQEAAGGVDEADRNRQLELVEHGRQGSPLNRGPDKMREGPGQADAGSRGIAGAIEIVDDEPRLDGDRDLRSIAHELPDIRPEKPVIDDEIV